MLDDTLAPQSTIRRRRYYGFDEIIISTILKSNLVFSLCLKVLFFHYFFKFFLYIRYSVLSFFYGTLLLSPTPTQQLGNLRTIVTI